MIEYLNAGYLVRKQTDGLHIYQYDIENVDISSAAH
jgi:hypothetical protein